MAASLSLDLASHRAALTPANTEEQIAPLLSSSDPLHEFRVFVFKSEPGPTPDMSVSRRVTPEYSHPVRLSPSPGKPRARPIPIGFPELPTVVYEVHTLVDGAASKFPPRYQAHGNHEADRFSTIDRESLNPSASGEKQKRSSHWQGFPCADHLHYNRPCSSRQEALQTC